MTTASEELAKRIDAIGRGKVNISFIYPPIPMRQFDWCATFDNDEPDDDGHKLMAGYGRTQIEALTDLLDLAEEQSP